MSPEDAKRQQALDESLADARTMLPRLWRQIYLGCIDSNFSEAESFKLTQTYIMAMTNTNGMQPPTGPSEKPDSDE